MGEGVVLNGDADRRPHGKGDRGCQGLVGPGAPAYLGTAVAGQGLVDLIDVGGHRFETSVEAVKAFFLDLFECLLGLLGSLSGRLELCHRGETGDSSVPRLSRG